MAYRGGSLQLPSPRPQSSSSSPSPSSSKCLLPSHRVSLPRLHNAVPAPQQAMAQRGLAPGSASSPFLDGKEFDLSTIDANLTNFSASQEMTDHSPLSLIPSPKSAECAAQLLAAARMPADGPEPDDGFLSLAMSNLKPTSEEEELLAAALVDSHDAFGASGSMLEAQYNNSGGSISGYGGLEELGELYPDLRGSGTVSKNKKKKRKRRDNVGKNASKTSKHAEFLASDADAGGSYNTPEFVEMQFPKESREVAKLMASTNRVLYGNDLMDFDGAKQRILQNDTSSANYAFAQREAPINGAVMMNAPITVFGSSIMGRVEPVTLASDEIRKLAIKEAKSNLDEQREKYYESIKANLLLMQR